MDNKMNDIICMDQYDNEIKPGMIITYPGRYGSTIYMRTMKVTEIIKEKNSYYDRYDFKIKGFIELEGYSFRDRKYIHYIKKVTFFTPSKASIISSKEDIKNIYPLLYNL